MSDRSPAGRLTLLGNVTCCLVLVFLWLPLLLLCAYAWPALDDFVEAQWGDFWTLQVSRYQRYTGRFVGSAVQALTPWHWQSLTGYRLSALMRLLLFLGALGAFVVALNRTWLRTTTTEVLYLSCLLSIALLTNLPSPAQLFYWYSSSVIYLVPFAVGLVAVSLLLRSAIDQPSFPRLMLSGLGFFYVSGNVEMLPLLALALGIPITVYYHTRPWARDLALMMLLTAFGLALNLLAPGNDVRGAQMSTVDRTQDLVGLGVHVVAQAFQSFTAWSQHRYTVLAALLATPVFWRRARQGLVHVHPLFAAAVWFYTLVVLYLPPLWGLGFTVERVDALCFCFFVLGLFGWSSAMTVHLQRRYAHSRPRRLVTAALPGILLFAAALCTLALPHRNRIRQAYDELLSGRAALYNAAEHHRAELTIHSRGDEVVVPPLGTVPDILAPIVKSTPFGDDVVAATPEEWWGNDLYATFYGKRTLRLGTPNERTDYAN